MNSYIRTEAERQREIEMISHPERWPLIARLPVKRATEGDDGLEMGLVLPGMVRVYLANIHDDATKLASCPHLDYASVDALVDDGWVVD